MTDHPDQPRASDDIVTGTRRVGSVSVPWGGLTVVAAAGAALAYLAMAPCRFGGWLRGKTYEYGCYTDILPLYYRDDLHTGAIPYLDQAVEYPVLTGGLMLLAARAVEWVPDTTVRGFAYFDLTAAVLAVALAVVVLGTGYLAGRGGLRSGVVTVNRKRALLAGGFVALAPAGLLAAFINWDLLAVALFTSGVVCWARGRYWLGGVFVGLATAAKFYPALAFGPLLVLVLRGVLGRQGGGVAPGDLLRSLAGAAAAWAAVNLPVYLVAPEGWAEFFAFSRERGADWGSIYYVLGGFGLFDAANRELVNLVGTVGFGAACAGVAALGVFARRRPTLEQLVFLVVAAFLITNKVWSPQFVLWLVPLAVLAWPRTMRPPVPAVFLGLWQLAEVGYHFGIWHHLRYVETLSSVAAPVGLDVETYALVALGRMIMLVMVCGLVVVDNLRDGEQVG